VIAEQSADRPMELSPGTLRDIGAGIAAIGGDDAQVREEFFDSQCTALREALAACG
jgi:hypothetical protein